MGEWGEELAWGFYREKGFDLVERNWQKRSGEIDLIVTKGKELVFVEVKTRTTTGFGSGEGAVTAGKKTKIKKTIQQFLNIEAYRNFSPRFEVVVVEFEGIKHKIIYYENVELD